MSPAAIDLTLEEVSSTSSNRFDSLRGVNWRINLGILPSASSSIDDLRRVTADSRRRYAGLRRRLLIDPQISKDGSNSSNLVMDNPLSQNPDSTWGRFFRNAELEKMVDQDLSRLYPEHGSYFQTMGCQGMLRRILLLWCLRHPDCGYRQGMHELLAPLLYVLHVDLERLTQVRKLHEDHFTDKFDGLSFHENDLTYNFDFKKFPDYMEDEIGSQGNAMKVRSLSELDPEIQTILLLSDAYGAEGELGIVLSEKFMEHDAYCMFDALMSGSAVSMAEFFSPTPVNVSYTSLIPVIEASAALYHLLSLVDSYLHNHLVELGVEPQYFALRWLRVLFGREFSLEDLLIIWDEIFAVDNGKLDKSAEDDVSSSFRVLISPRGAFISAFAVSMILYLRSSLLATENATTCLQRLLKFPASINLKKLIDKAKSLQALALETNISSSSHFLTGNYEQSKKMVVRGHSLSSDSVSPKTPLNLVPESYWEEKWRVLHKEETMKEGGTESASTPKKRWTEKVRLSLSRTESDPLAAKSDRGKKHTKSSVRRSLLEDLSRVLGSEEESQENTGKVNCQDEVIGKKDDLLIKVMGDGPEGSKEDCTCTEVERCFTVNIGSEKNSSIFSSPESPHSGANDNENYSEKSSVASNLSPDENDDHLQMAPVINSLIPVSGPPGELPKSGCNNDLTGKSVDSLKERKVLSGKFQWFWKFGRNVADEGPSEKEEGDLEATKVAKCDNNQSKATGSLSTEGTYGSFSDKGDAVDQNVMDTLRNLGHSMLEHIQVMESVFQQDRGQVSKNVIVGKGQVTAMTALKELRKISNILSEM